MPETANQGLKRPMQRAHLKLVWTFLLCSCIVSGLLFFKIRRLNKYEEKSLEFQTISNAEDDAIDLEQRLKRADLFYSDFVPKEYTGYMKQVDEKRVQKRALLVEAQEANMILNANEQGMKSTTMSTTTSTLATSTTPLAMMSSTTIGTSSSTMTSTLGVLERTVEDLKERIQNMDKNSKIDPRLIRMLNETISVEPNQEIVVIVQSMVEKLENQQLEELEHPETNEVILDECADVNAFKILPNDDVETARRKQGKLIKCYMDESVDPCERFYDYACGNWNSYHPIPRDRGGYDTFEILREDLDAKLKNMLSERVTETDNNATAATKILYSSCMNTNNIESRRENPLLNLLDSMGGWPVLKGQNWNNEAFNWQETIAKLRQFNNDILVTIWVGPDGKNSDDYVVQFDQSDLLLPSAEYYQLGFNHPIIQSYYNVLFNVATLLGADPALAKREMKDLIEFEMNLASIMIPPHERRNYSEIYRKVDLGTLTEEIPGFNFTSYLKALLPRPLEERESVVMFALPYFKRLTNLIEMTDKRIVANYILWRFVRHRINNLDQRFQNAQQELFRSLYGREETPPRWKFCVAYGNGNLGNSVGALFVKKYFDEQSKADMETLTDLVQAEFKLLVTEGTWLTDRTKKLAEEKIEAIVRNIGYPDFILDDVMLQTEVEGLNYKEDEFFENVLKNLRWRTTQEMGRLDQRVNRTLWTATPAVVNAYYSRNKNQIMFPAGILQPPFYHKHFPKSLNYGGIGVVIGHEITHGFDDKGRQFDHIGNINQWWDHESSERFHNRAQCIIDQYNNYKVEEVGIYLNGMNTQGENIADNGGIKQSYYAYKNWLRMNDVQEETAMPGLEHLSHDQLFFLNFAQVWCGTTRPEALRSKLKTAVHAPGKYRVIGTLSNSQEFSKAYKCPLGSKMNPVKKCTIW